MIGEKMILPRGHGSFLAGIVVGDWLYYSAKNMNGLFKKNLYTGENIFICRFERYNSLQGVHEDVFRLRQNLYFIPFGNVEKVIAVYHLEKETVEYIDLPKASFDTIGRVSSGVIVGDDMAWIMPCEYDAILCLDGKTGVFKRYDNWPKIVLKHGLNKYKFASSVLVGDKIYLCPYDCPALICFDIKTKQVNILSTDVECRVYKKILHYENKLYLYPENLLNGVLCFDLSKRKKETIELIPEGPWSTGSYSAIGSCGDGVVWMFPYEGDYIVKYNPGTRETETFKLCQEGYPEGVSARFLFNDVREFDGKILVSMEKAASPYLIVRDGEICAGTIEIQTELQIHNLLSCLTEEKEEKKAGDRNCIGEDIYRTLW